MKETSLNTIRLAENAAALSDVFHVDKDSFISFYHSHANALNGFPGIWNWVGRAAIIFTEEEERVQWDGEWIDIITDLGEWLVMPDTIDLPTEKQIRSKIRQLFRAHKVRRSRK